MLSARPSESRAGDLQDAHLIAPAVRPARQNRCRPRKATTSGATERAAAATTVPAGTWPFESDHATRPTETVCRLRSVRSIAGSRKLFQTATNWNRKMVTSDGSMSLRPTVAKMRSSPAPSSLAASMSSSGTLWAANTRERYTPNGLTTLARMKAIGFPSSPTWWNIRNSGSVKRIFGMSTAASTVEKTTPRPRKSYLASA